MPYLPAIKFTSAYAKARALADSFKEDIYQGNPYLKRTLEDLYVVKEQALSWLEDPQNKDHRNRPLAEEKLFCIDEAISQKETDNTQKHIEESVF